MTSLKSGVKMGLMKNIFKKFLNGEYSLLVAFWVFGSVPGLIIAIFSIIVEIIFPITGMYLFSLLILIYSIVWFFGIKKTCEKNKSGFLASMLSMLSAIYFIGQSIFYLIKDFFF